MFLVLLVGVVKYISVNKMSGNTSCTILKDDKGNILFGGFYEQEINKIKFGGVYLIEKQLRLKGSKLLERQKGYDKSYDSWIDKSTVI